MITADTLKTLTTFTAPALTRAINLAGYKQDRFTGAKFLGMTNAGEFCYNATFVDSEGDECNTKEFVKYDPAEGKVSAEY
jgi:hypothetical protein